jgi:asparagine synthase (glutamine-hydrolysing)
MTGLLAHRGPDDSGHLFLDTATGRDVTGDTGDGGRRFDLALGNRRLAILDLSERGHQPLVNEGGDCFLVFNGELYNYEELRRTLQGKGYCFRSEGDTEVVLRAYEAWGEACVERFNGMWAFAIWDQRRQRLFCSRDRFGIKPFYYCLTREAFIFGSEIKAILAVQSETPRAAGGVLRDQRVDGAVCRGPGTFFEGIVRLPPAHHLFVTADGVEERRYWNYDSASGRYDTAHAAETLRELLTDSVSRCLKSDVPVGLALSGGIDSTAILSCMAALGRGAEAPPIHAYHATFPGYDFDESPYAREAAERYGAELHVVEYEPGSLVDDLRRVIWHLDYPSPEAQVLPRFKLMQEAARNVTVILEGQGADEMLAGYPKLYLVPSILDELGGAGVRGLPRAWKTWSAAGPGNDPRLVLRHLASVVPWAGRVRRRRAVERGVISREFLGSHGGEDISWAEAPTFGDRLTRALHRDHARDVLPRLLKFGDALSMGASVESRVPFLDHRIVEFVFQLSHLQKMEAGLDKVLLRRAFGDELPKRLLERRKKIGFFTPITQWLQQSQDAEIAPILLSSRCLDRGLFDLGAMERVIGGVRRGEFEAGSRLFEALSVELWHQLFIDGDGVGSLGAPKAARFAAPM